MAYSRWFLSDWYIYWQCGDSEERDEQLLAIWHTTSDPVKTFKYPKVEEMFHKDDWSDLDVVITEKEILIECVEEWLKEVREIKEE